MAKRKLRIGVLFGGRSAEHEVSLVSAESVIANLERKKYRVVPIGIGKDGRWLVGREALKLLKSAGKIPARLRQRILPEPVNTWLDVAFPLVHGTFGEDGTLQGLLEMAGIPYVGAGVLGSAVGMDKITQKQIYEAVGIPTPKFDYLSAAEFAKAPLDILRRLKKLRLPVFVKPANLGSSVGISRVKRGSELKDAIKLALKYDRRVIVEKSIEKSMEVEVAILGNDNPKASMPGQVVSSNEFYDYDAKYIDGKSKLVIPAPLPAAITKEVCELAVRAFKALDLAGMARVDFLVQRQPWRVYLNEVNTIPGFTSISMYPRLWAATGLPYAKLLDKLIDLARERFAQRKNLATTYKAKSKWYH